MQEKTAPLHTVAPLAEPTPPRRKRSLRRRIARGIGIGIGSLIGLVVLALVFLQTPWGKSFIRGRVEAKLAAKVTGKVHVGSIDYSFLFGHIELGDVSITDPAGNPAIKLASLAVELDRTSLLSGEPVIEDLAIHGLDVTLVQTAEGRTNLTGLARPSSGAPLARIRVLRLAVTGAATITKPDGTVIAVRDLGLHGSLDARPRAKQLELALADVVAKAAITPPGGATRNVDVGIGAIALGRRADAIDVDVKHIAAGALGIDALGAHVRLAGASLHGDQAITLAGVRIDSAQLASLLGKQVLINDLAIEASVTGPESQLAIDGTVRTGGATLALAGTVDLSSPAVPTYRLSVVGDKLRSDLVHSERPLPEVQSGVRIELAGSGTLLADLDAQLDVAVGPTTIGKLAVDGVTVKASAHHGSYQLDHLHAGAPGVDLDAEATLAADHAVHGTLTVRGEPARVAETLAAAGIVLPRRAPLPPKLELAVTATGNLDGAVAVELAPTRLALAGGAVSLAGAAQLEHGKLASAHTEVGLHGLDLGKAAVLAGKRPKVAGSVSGTIELTATPAGQRADYRLAVALRKPALAVTVTGTAGARTATARIEAARASDHVVLVTATAALPLVRVHGKPTLNRKGKMTIAVDVARRSLAELVALAPDELRRKLALPPGTVEAHVALAGTPLRPTGTFDVTADAAKLAHVTQKLALHGELTSSDRGFAVATTGTIWIDAARDAIATLAGTVALPPLRFVHGKPDLAALRAGATVDGAIDIPERELASLAFVKAKLAEVGGSLVGHIAVTGPLAVPSIDATVKVHGYRTATGGAGETTLTATGTPVALTAELKHGDAIAITAAIDRAVKGRIGIRAHAAADHAPLLSAIPAFVAGKIPRGAEPGALSWDMTATLALVQGTTGFSVEDAALTGTLDVAGGVLAVPHSDRRLHDIGLAVSAEPTGLRITSLVAHESDAEVADRTLSATGVVAWTELHPTTVTLELAARDWLLFGSPTLGPADAPRAAADFDLGVAVDLTAPIATIDATVNSLALRAPDRLDRSHQPEAASISGDVIFLGPSSGPAGRLPVALAAAEPLAGGGGAAAAPRHRKPIDVRIHIPRPIRLNQTPFDVMAHGELTVAVRDDGVNTRGGLTMDSGTLSLFGQNHDLVEGSLTFTDEHPHGWMDLTFEHALPREVMRELSKASAGGGARVSFAGSPTKPKTSLSGAANAGLAEVMAMDEAGRPVYTSAPDLPASATVQAPRGDQLFMLTFMASNLPHLLFLDRITAYADPYQSAASYGRIENVEAEAYQRHSRVRAVVRPRTPGRSSAELQYDRLLIDTDQTAVGIGVRAGDRLGGGVGVFVEWSSRD